MGDYIGRHRVGSAPSEHQTPLPERPKRRNDSATASPRKRARSASPLAPSGPRRSPTDLSAYVRPSQLPDTTYRALQRLLDDQNTTIRDLSGELRHCHDRMRSYGQDRTSFDDRVDRDARRLKDQDRELTELRAYKRELQDTNECHAKLIKKGTEALTNTNNKIEQLTKYNERLIEEANVLRTKTGKNTASTTPRDVNGKNVPKAPAADVVNLALEAQAQRHLELVRGLNKIIAEHEAKIKTYEEGSYESAEYKTLRAEFRKRGTLIQTHEARLAERSKSVLELSGKMQSLSDTHENLKKEMRQLRTNEGEQERSMGVLNRQVAEQAQLLVDQQALIERYKHEVARLGGPI